MYTAPPIRCGSTTSYRIVCAPRVLSYIALRLRAAFNHFARAPGAHAPHARFHRRTLITHLLSSRRRRRRRRRHHHQMARASSHSPTLNRWGLTHTQMHDTVLSERKPANGVVWFTPIWPPDFLHYTRSIIA